MPMSTTYEAVEPRRSEIDAARGLTLLEFGAPWCGICRGAQPSIAAALAQAPEVQHLKIADGRGLALGRSFGVKLWPTLVLMKDGAELGRVVRPQDRESISALLSRAHDTALRAH